MYPPFSDVRARKALLYMVNQKDVMRALGGDPSLQQECHALFICGTPNDTDVGAVKAQDLETARRLMAEAGYKGEPIYLLDPTDVPILHTEAIVVAEQLRRIGVNVKLIATDRSGWRSRRNSKEPPEKGGWHLFTTTATSFEVGYPHTNFAANSRCGGETWPGWPCSEEIEELREAWTLTADTDQRFEILKKLQKALYNNVNWIPLGQWQSPATYRKRITGVLTDAPLFVYWNIKKE
jgi:peptide/nickel transport system substrate-binding protein